MCAQRLQQFEGVRIDDLSPGDAKSEGLLVDREREIIHGRAHVNLAHRLARLHVSAPQHVRACHGLVLVGGEHVAGHGPGDVTR